MGKLDGKVAFVTGAARGQGRSHAYTASKHGVVGLMRSYANNLARHRIRVNTVHPTGVNTPMVVNDFMQQWLANGMRILRIPQLCGRVFRGRQKQSAIGTERC